MIREKCKDLIGRKARLRRDVHRRDGVLFHAGTVVQIDGTWRGRYHVFSIATGSSVRHLSHDDLELIS